MRGVDLPIVCIESRLKVSLATALFAFLLLTNICVGMADRRCLVHGV